MTPATACAIGIAIGLPWLAAVPLMNGRIAAIWRVRPMSMPGGVAVLAHQPGAFAGGSLGGTPHDATGTCGAARGVAIALIWPTHETATPAHGRAA